MAKESPAPLAGGNRAGSRVGQLLDSTALTRDQTTHRLRRERHIEAILVPGARRRAATAPTRTSRQGRRVRISAP